MAMKDEATLILNLYELRREATMRTARDWFAREFHPESVADIEKVVYSEHSGHFRMVIGYWDMAAALVNNGAISVQLFTDTNGEHFGVFGKMEPFIKDLRKMFGGNFLLQLEKLIDATSGGRERAVAVRERMKAIRARLAAAKD